jgi:hypothetical protein
MKGLPSVACKSTLVNYDKPSTLENEKVSANKNKKKSNREKKDDYLDNPSIDEVSC